MNKFELCKHQIDKVKANAHLYKFPDFLKEIRRAHCINMRIVSNDLEIPYNKVYILEFGLFKKIPEVGLLTKLAVYFDIPLMLLAEKAQDFVIENKEKEQVV